MRYSIEPRDRIYVKGYGFLSFAKNMSKNLSNKYSQKLLDTAEKSTTDAMKTTSKRAIKKRAEATGDLICNKIDYKITSVSKRSKNNEKKKKMNQKHQKKDTYLQKKDNKLLIS